MRSRARARNWVVEITNHVVVWATFCKISEKSIDGRLCLCYVKWMARARKRHLQQEMFDSRGKPKGRGGKRPGAGRPPKGKRAGAPHKRRPTIKSYQPNHIVLRVHDDLGSLRKRHMYRALREATIAVALRELHDDVRGAFRIVHISIQRNHVHLLVEADHKVALSRGMQSFQISAAKHLNRAVSVQSMRVATKLRASGTTKADHAVGSSDKDSVTLTVYRRAMAKRRRGTVFPDRFHQEIITSRNQARHTLAYVLNNWRKHREDRGAHAQTWNVDPFSSGVLFDGWKEREDEVTLWRWRDTYDPLVVYLPKTWLLREGWRMYGLVGFHDLPGGKRQPADA
jgi:REP element-mobilizing transposase RayT